MNSTPNQLVVRPAILGYVFGARQAELETGEKGIEVRYKTKRTTIVYDQLFDSFRHERGLFFDRITITAQDNQYSIGWLKPAIATNTKKFARKALYAFFADPILELSDKIKTHLANHYPRQRYWERALKTCQSWQSVYRALPSEDILTEKQREAFRHIDLIAREDTITLESLQEAYTQQQLHQYDHYFDTVESNPLTERQRLACVVDEANNLVLAGAGSGKTSVMIGRAGYLLKSEQATSEEILMLAFANKAAGEMSERITEKLSIDSIKASTFHSLGQFIITTVEKGKPSLSVLATDEMAYTKFIQGSFYDLMEQEDYKELAIKHFVYHDFEAINPFAFGTTAEYNQAVRDNDFRTMQGEMVKGYQELLIANFLYRNGIKYQYEAKYEINTKTLEFRQYQPDFYLPDSGIYIEHYGIDRDGRAAPYIDGAKYREGMKWKRELHQANQTVCIETFHYDWVEEALLERLEEHLLVHDVILNPVPSDEILSILGRKDKIKSGRRVIEKPSRIEELCQLLGNMLKLYKASNLDESLFTSAETTPTPTTLTQKLLDKLLSLVAIHSSKSSNLARLQSAEKLLMPLYEKYQQHLLAHDDIDFDDMINKAIGYVQNGDFTPPWKFIMVDEFQDISSSRASLVTALRDSVEDCSVFCVGDDWQAIYRFAGSDLSFVTQFEAKFGTTQITSLDKTFRFNNSISDIASRFVTRNPDQIVKDISTYKQVSTPAVSLLRADHVKDEERLNNLHQVLTAISVYKEESDVLLLSRYRFKLPDKGTIRALEEAFGNLTIQAMTIHASKGKEADFVVVLGLEDGKFGFPSMLRDHPLIDALLPKTQDFSFAEERRLFYVAITRAKDRTYLVVDMKNPSRFVIEMINDEYPIELDEFEVSGSQLVYQQTHCVRCEIGKMLPRKGQYGDFYGCSCYPRCKHLENGCSDCGSVMKHSGDYKICTNPECNGWVALCPECGGELSLRKGRYGDFWGCKNYRSQGLSCGYTVNHIIPPIQQNKEVEELVF